MMSEVDCPDVTVFGWGMTCQGQLGLGGVEEEQVTVPTVIRALHQQHVKKVACGRDHTLFEVDGILSCGSNEHGQLGQEMSSKKPGEIEMLKNQMFNQLGCGRSHSVALTDTGQLFSWGSDEFGQLGRGQTEDPYSIKPKLVKTLSPYVIIQIACGYNHCIALSSYGRLYTWGDNRHGQLGLGIETPEKVSTPTELMCLHGLTSHQIAAGGYHSFMLTTSGALFGWGKNRFGQLGLGEDISDRYFPTLVKTLRSQAVRYVACGEEHTVALTVDGGVFTFGAGAYGQLGHNSKQNELLPKKVFELMGSIVTQVACGRCHTLAYVASSGNMSAFGLGANGQLGVGTKDAHRTNPSLVKGPFVPPGDTKSNKKVGTCNQFVVKEIFAGGDQSFVIGMPPSCGISPINMCHDRPLCQQVATLSDKLLYTCSSVPAGVLPEAELIEDLEQVFSSLSCHNGSFLEENYHMCSCSSRNSGINYKLAADYYARLAKLPNGHIVEAIIQSIENNLLPSLSPSPPDVEALRVYLSLPWCHAFDEFINRTTLICSFARALTSLNNVPAKIVGIWWSQLESEYFIKLISIYKQVVLHILSLSTPTSAVELQTREKNLTDCLNVLNKLNTVNDDRSQAVPIECFYINELQDKIDIRMDYVKWLRIKKAMRTNIILPPSDSVSLCSYPFVYNAQAKTVLLQTDALVQMQFAVEEVTRRNMSNMFMPAIDIINPCLMLYVSRNNLVQDTISQIQKAPQHDLKKPLKIIFVGEEGQDHGGLRKVIFLGEEAVDEGGVRKEFFLLLLTEILDPKYGMFKNYEESRLLWFQEQPFEEDNAMFMLIGVLCGLAIYNASIIDLKFPLALYKKLLNKPVTLDDLVQLDPSVGRSLKELLEYDGDDLEDTFCLTFEISREVFGEVTRIPLVKNGADIPVTKENRKEYIDAYVDYIFNKSVEEQFKAFYDGFHRVCGGSVLQLFHPQELQAMVVGNENYNWDEFEECTEYKAEYHKDHKTIKLFWEVFRELNHEQKKQFLLFLTGSNRIPIHGMKAVKMTIQPTGGGEQFLPVAHTCFNLLDLPKYEDKEKLRSKLLLAIQHSQGFALV